MTWRLRARDGIAMVAALLAVVVLGIVIAGVFFASSQELQTGRNFVLQEQALASSEQGLAMMLSGWDRSWTTELPVGGSVQRSATTQEAANIATHLTRLTRTTYWLTSEALVGPNADARRATGVLLRLALPDLHPLGALAVRFSPAASGHDPIQGAVLVDGTDATPPSWGDCRPPGAPVAGLVTNATPSSLSSNGGCRIEECVHGSPPILVDTTISDPARPPFDPETWAGLTSRASLRFPGGSVVGSPDRRLEPRVHDGRCDTSVDLNWGDPSRTTACATYFPVIHVRGDLQMASGVGQGTLLVDGDLTISGGAQFVGAVFVRGALRTGAGGARVVGMTRVGGAGERPSMLLDGAELSFSRCATLAALAAGAAPEIIPRSWIEVR